MTSNLLNATRVANSESDWLNKSRAASFYPGNTRRLTKLDKNSNGESIGNNLMNVNLGKY